MGRACRGRGRPPEAGSRGKDIRELFRKLADQYPGVAPFIDRGIAVAIDGVIYRDTWSKELPEGAEIFLLPRLAGG